MTIQLTGVCRHCTVRIESGDTCDFCRTYVPPTEHEHRCTHCGDDQTVPCDRVTAGASDAPTQFDRLANLLQLSINDNTTLMESLPSDAPLWASIDLVAAQRYLRAAARLIDQAADRMTAVAK